MAEGGEWQSSDVIDISPTSSSSELAESITLDKGQRIDQRFKNSRLKVEGCNIEYIIVSSNFPDQGGGQNENETRMKKFRRNIRKIFRPSSLSGRLVESINANTHQEAALGIREAFRNENLREPNFVVFPQMRKVDVGDYYKGRHEKNGYKSDTITFEEVMSTILEKDDSSDSVGFTAIVASAGSGKTTLTRRIAQESLEKFPVKEGSEKVSLKKRKQKMVHYIEVKEIKEQESIKTSRFLFGGLYKSKSDEDQAFKWLVRHQSDAILIFDGLDQARWDFVEGEIQKIKPYDKASTSVIMYNILARNLLPRVKIFVASREFKISELPAKARPKDIIALHGLTPQDARKLFVFLLKDNGAELWSRIEIMSPRLLHLVCVPVFLMLAAVLMGRDPNRPPPNTVTELYDRIISVLPGVENIRNRENIRRIIHKLKAVSFHGMEKGMVTFKKTDFSKFGLDAFEVQDLMTKVPDSNILSHHLMEGDFKFYFCHQSFQEFLAASFVAEMDLHEFSRFDEKYRGEERWSVVRRFLAGIVFSKSSNDFQKVSDKQNKQHVLSKSILSQLEDIHFRMELYTIIYESDSEELIKELSIIDTSRISLSRDEAHVIGSLVARSGGLESLTLYDCNIDDESLDIIARCFRERIHVKRVNLECNPFSAKALQPFFPHCRNEFVAGNLDWEILYLAVEHYELRLKKDGRTINIFGECTDPYSSDCVVGCFNMENSTLIFENCYKRDQLVVLEFVQDFFETECMKIDHHFYLTQDEILRTPWKQLQKMKKILIHCKKVEIINWTFLVGCASKYQLDLMDIALDGLKFKNEHTILQEQGIGISNVDAHIHIHWLFKVQNLDDIRRIINTRRQNKIGYIRCQFRCKYRPSLGDIISLIKNCNSKKVTLVYREGDMLKGEELEKVREISNVVGVHVEVSQRNIHAGGRLDAWNLVDHHS